VLEEVVNLALVNMFVESLLQLMAFSRSVVVLLVEPTIFTRISRFWP